MATQLPLHQVECPLFFDQFWIEPDALRLWGSRDWYSKLKKPMRPDSPQGIELVPLCAARNPEKLRRTLKDEDEYEYGLSAGDGDDAEWAGEPEVEVDEEEEGI